MRCTAHNKGQSSVLVLLVLLPSLLLVRASINVRTLSLLSHAFLHSSVVGERVRRCQPTIVGDSWPFLAIRVRVQRCSARGGGGGGGEVLVVAPLRTNTQFNNAQQDRWLFAAPVRELRQLLCARVCACTTRQPNCRRRRCGSLRLCGQLWTGARGQTVTFAAVR